jgi:hypothetical protein
MRDMQARAYEARKNQYILLKGNNSADIQEYSCNIGATNNLYFHILNVALIT